MVNTQGKPLANGSPAGPRPIALAFESVDGEVQSQIGNDGELVCWPGRASVSADTGAAAGTRIVVVDAVTDMGATTTTIDVAAVDEAAVPTGMTMAPGVAAVQTGRSPLPASVADTTRSPDFSS